MFVLDDMLSRTGKKDYTRRVSHVLDVNVTLCVLYKVDSRHFRSSLEHSHVDCVQTIMWASYKHHISII